jgi:transcriptional regulator with XRE-family HTH domain
MHQHIDYAGLARLAIDMGVSQREIARVLGVDQSTVSRLLSGLQAELRGTAAVGLIKLAGGQVVIPDTGPAVEKDGLQRVSHPIKETSHAE